MDGIIWKVVAALDNLNAGGGNSSILSGAWNGKQWIVIAWLYGNFGYTMYSSYDAITWTSSGSSTALITANSSIWVGCIPTLQYSYNGVNWSTSTSAFAIFAYYVQNAFYGNSIWVAVGRNTSNSGGAIAYSTDGISWTASSNVASIITTIWGVAWNGSMWIATGNISYAQILYSYDAISWSIATIVPQNLFINASQNVNNGTPAWTGTRWIVANVSGGSFNALTSPDGITWTGINLPPTTTTNVACRRVGYPVPVSTLLPITEAFTVLGGNGLYYSYDGLSWLSSASATTLFPAGSFVNFVVWNGQMWLAGGGVVNSGARVIQSSDGINWKVVTALSNVYSSGSTCDYAAWNGSTWIVAILNAANGARHLYSSYDAITWTVSTVSPSGAQYLMSIAANSKQWQLGSYNGVYGSYNGIHWQLSPTSSTVFTSNWVYGVAWNGILWVAVGTSSGAAPGGAIAYSTDGYIWTAVPNSNGLFTSSVNAIGWNGIMWVAAGSSNNTIAYSYDGINWTAATSANGLLTTTYPMTVVWNGTLWIVTGATNSAIYSRDGITWSISSATAFTSVGRGAASRRVLVDIYENNAVPATLQPVTEAFTVLGGYGLYYSYDGLTWISSASANALFTQYSFINFVVWNGQMWLAGGQNVNNGARVIQSSDGITWRVVTALSNVYSNGSSCDYAAWNGSMWLVAIYNAANGARYLYSSYDAITWTVSTNSPSGAQIQMSIAANSRQWQLGGYNGIYSSYDGMTWELSPSSSTLFASNWVNGIAWNGVLWVAVGTSSGAAPGGAMAYSTDVITWLGVPNINGLFTSTVNAIGWNGSMWVAAGSSNNTIAYSYDGIAWTAATSANGLLTITLPMTVVWNGTLWIVTGGTSSAIYSRDGITWSVSSVGAFTSLGRGAASRRVLVDMDANDAVTPTLQTNNFMVVGGQGISYSYDGVKWFPSITGNALFKDANQGVRFVVWNGSYWLAGGSMNNTGARLATSPDGIVWRAVASMENLYGANGLFQYGAWNGTMWIVIIYNNGVGNFLYYSYDAITWTLIGGGGSGIVASANLWIQCSTIPAIQYSYDGINWQVSSSAASIFGTGGASAVRTVGYNGSMWIASGLNGTFLLAYSYDGINWTQVTNVSGSMTTGWGIGWNGQMWVISGQGGAGGAQIIYSYDGINWTDCTAIPGTVVAYLGPSIPTWNGARWIVTNGVISTNTRVLTSTDGINWSIIDISPQLAPIIAVAARYSPTYLQEKRYTIGNSPYITSSSMITTTIGTSQTAIYQLAPMATTSSTKLVFMVNASFAGQGANVQLTVGRHTTSGASASSSTNITSGTSPLVLPSSNAYYMAASSSSEPVNLNGFATDMPGAGNTYYTIWMSSSTSGNYSNMTLAFTVTKI
jgi:hypothetical protein